MADEAPLPVDAASSSQAAQIQNLTDLATQAKPALSVTAPNVPASENKPASFDVGTFVSSAWGKLQGAISGASQELQQKQEQGAAATAQQQGGIQASAEGSIMANAVVASSAMQQKSDALSDAARYGVTPGAPGREISDAAAQIRSDLAEYTARDKDMQQRRQTGFLDDPIQWMVNQSVLPYQEKLQVMTEQSMNAQQSTILKAQAATSGSIQLATSTDAADAARKLDALNQQIRGEAEQKASESAMKLAQFGQQGLQVRDSLNQAQFTSAIQASDVQMKQQELFLQQGYKAMQEQMLGLRLDEKKMTDADKLTYDTALKGLGNFIGMPSLNSQSVKLMDKDQREALTGMIGASALGDGRLGANAGDALTNLNTMNADLSGSPGMDYVRKAVNSHLETALATPMMQQKLGNKQFGQLPMGARADITGQVVSDLLHRETANRPTEGGITSPDPIGKILPIINAAAPALAAAIAPAVAANPLGPTDPQLLASTQIRRIKAGEITPQQAAKEHSDVALGINTDVMQKRNWKQLALPPLKSYNVPLSTDSGGLFNPKKTVDTASQAALTAFYTRAAISDNDDLMLLQRSSAYRNRSK